MKTIFIPDYSAGNPYQNELAQALSKYDVTVSIYKPRGMLRIFRIIWKFGKINLVHLHWTTPLIVRRGKPIRSIVRGSFFLIQILALKLMGIKIVWTVHNLWGHESRYLERKIEIFFNRILVRSYDLIFTHCLSAREDVIRLFQIPSFLHDKILTVPHGNYIGNYQNTITQAEARAKLGLNKSGTVFLYFGQIRPYKSVFNLIRTFKNLEDPSAALIIVGKAVGGHTESQVVEACKSDNRIKPFIGFVPDDEIQLYMNSADVVVLPFQNILTSGSLILALSFGKPVICPKIGCIPETLDENTGFLYDPDDENGLLKSFKNASASNLHDMGKKAHDKVNALSWKLIAKHTYAGYKKTIK